MTYHKGVKSLLTMLLLPLSPYLRMLAAMKITTKLSYLSLCAFLCPLLHELWAGGKDPKGITIELTLNNINSQQPDINVAQSSAQNGEFAQLSAQQTYVPIDDHSHHEAHQNQSQAQCQEASAAPAASNGPWGTNLAGLLGMPRKHPFLAAGATYAGLVASLVYARRTFRSTEAWSRWKRETSLDNLRIIPLEALSADLIREIQLRYLNPSAPLDNLWPLAQFVRDVTREERLLSWYISVSSIVTRLWIGPFFWTCSSRIKQAQNQRERLRFLQKAFQLWAAGHRPAFSTTKAT